MMALSKHKLISVITYLVIAILLCTLTPQVEPKLVRRQANCQDGEYEHDGRKCCLCPAGTKVTKHCTGDQAQPPCEPCPTGQFQSHANQEMKCEECTACENNPNANLVVDKRCTVYTDSTCKCKANHYCPSARTPCRICEPCKECGPEGEKVACSATNNTICNDKLQGSSPLGVILGVIIPLVVLGIAVVLYCCWKKRKEDTISESRHEDPAEVMPLSLVAEPELPERLTPYIPDIAELIGWITMRNLAMRSNIPRGTIESCEARHPNNNVENTIALLMIWEEKEGKDAAHKLINYLKETNQKTTADDVQKILRASSSNGRV